MADLVSHLLINRLAGHRLGPGVRGWFISGAVVPDLAGRVPEVVLRGLASLGFFDAGWAGRVGRGFDCLHTPVGIAATAAFLAAATPERFLRPLSRPGAAVALLLGGALHLAIDVLQIHIRPSYALLFPFSTRRWELAVVGSEASVFWLPVLLPLVLGLWVWERRCS